MTKLCSKCGKRKKTEEFSFRNRSAGLRRKECKECFSSLSKTHYKLNKTEYLSRNNKKRISNRDWILEYLSSHPCKDCGTEDIRILEFDHLSDKSYEVSLLLGKTYGLDTIKKEIEKCEVVCRNCHQIRTYKRNNSYRYLYWLSKQSR